MESLKGNIVSTPMPDSHQKNEAGETLRRNVFLLDGTIVPGAPYVAATWYCAEYHPEQRIHTHDFDEFLTFMGTDPEHPDELGARMRMCLGDEWIDITKSCVIFVPAGTPHCEYATEEITRPILTLASCSTGGKYCKNEQ